MRYSTLFLGTFCLACLPALSWGTPPSLFPPPGPNQPPPVQGNKPAGNRILRVDVNVPIILSYSAPGEAPNDRARLFIPKKLAGALALDGTGGGERTLASERTWASGLALSAAFVTGGVWLSRRPTKSAGAKMLICLFITATALVTICQTDLVGNAPNPYPFGRPLVEPAPPRPPVPVVIQGNRIQFGIDVVILAEGEHVELVLPKSLMPANGLKNPGQPGR